MPWLVGVEYVVLVDVGVDVVSFLPLLGISICTRCYYSLWLGCHLRVTQTDSDSNGKANG
jgi:hypothetical protein